MNCADRIASCIKNGCSDRNFVIQKLATQHRMPAFPRGIHLSHYLFERLYRMGREGRQVGAANDISNSFVRQFRKNGHTTGRAIGWHSMADERCAEYFVLRGHAHGIDNPDIIEKRKVNSFVHAASQLEHDRVGALQHRIEPQQIMGHIENTQAGQIAAVSGIAGDYIQFLQRMNDALRRTAVDSCRIRDWLSDSGCRAF